MDKTIETAFLKAFDFGGVVHLCFDWLSQKYDLGFKLNEEYENKPKEELKGKWKEYYDTKLPQIINKQTAEFDDSVIKYKDSPLIDEIASNLDSLNGLQRDRYIFSLLKPFKEFSDNVHPDAIISQLKGDVKGICGISDYERDLILGEEAKKESIDRAKADEAEKQANACRHFIKENNYRIKRANYVANRYREIWHTAFEKSCNNTEHNENNINSVEYCFDCFSDVQHIFAQRLDAMLLERGLNLFWYQKECGIYLYTHRDITYLEFFLGSYELTKKYIDEALPKISQPQQVNNGQTTGKLNLPSELNTEEAKRYFDKAIDLGLMDEKYRWLKGLQMLACFAREMSLKLNLGKGQRISWRPFETLFEIEKGKLRSNYNDIQKTGQDPIESTLIDNVFE